MATTKSTDLTPSQPALNQASQPPKADQPVPGEIPDNTARARTQNAAGEVRLDQNQPGQQNQQDQRRLVSIDRSRVNSEIDAWANFAQQTELKDGQEHVLKITVGMDGDFHVDRSIAQKPV